MPGFPVSAGPPCAIRLNRRRLRAKILAPATEGSARPMEIAHRRVATVHFTLTGEDGSPITSTRGHDPLVYMHGTGSIVAGLEEALEGRSPGDRFEVTVTPDKGFGPRHPELVQTHPRSIITDGAEPRVGARLDAQTAKGPMEVVVTA